MILLYFFSPFYRVYRYLMDQFSLVRDNPEQDHQHMPPPKIRNPEAMRLIGDYDRMMQEIRLSRKRLEASLEEKRTLLKEVHHRVKNNLQIISSLLSLQSSYIDEEALLTTFEESILRIHSMAHIHETIYATGSFQAIQMQGYIQSVVDTVHQSLAAPGFQLDLKYDLDAGELDIDKAILCGLILTEIVTNCYKHAFSGRREGSLSVRYRNEADTAVLTVVDDGTGVEGDLLEQEFGSLGITLIKSLSAQLGGHLSFRLNGGSEFSLRIQR
jgi:two-component sensor histidine kinase